MITNVLIFTNIFCVLALALTLVVALKALRLVDLLEMQLGLQQEDIRVLRLALASNEDQIEAVARLTRHVQESLNKRIRKLEQKDGQIKGWINTTVECFENQQDQLDTLGDQVFDKPAGEKKDE